MMKQSNGTEIAVACSLCSRGAASVGPPPLTFASSGGWCPALSWRTLRVDGQRHYRVGCIPSGSFQTDSSSEQIDSDVDDWSRVNW
jgi:hypothetical protein